ncbi:GGDEF domain-containing protein [Erythrobacter sp. GH1-10]|uniref:GGDEF domain-containing protein n=1 Tax=Erythrobacter sp. GH1-10 TaxID=3349334 RepID=UPI0038783970
MQEALPLEPAREYAEAERALEDDLSYDHWSETLRAEHTRRTAPRTAQLVRFQLILGAVVAAFTLLWDLLVLPDLFEIALGWRLVTVVPLTVIGLYLLARQRLGLAKIAMGASIVSFGMIAMHLATFGSEAVMTRYVMAATFLLGIACIALPFTPRELRRFMVAYTLFTGLVALWPNPLEPMAATLHLAFALLVGGTSVAVATNYWNIDAQGFLKDLREEATREALEHSNQLLRQLSERDPLTGSLNRRGFERVFAKLIAKVTAAKADPSGTVPIGRAAVLMIDLDHFKQFNDTHGHQAGDTCLRMVAQAIEDVFAKAEGIVGRFGGEEFVVAFHEVQAGETIEMAERTRLAIASLLVPAGPLSDGDLRPLVTASIGIGLSEPIMHALDEEDGAALREDLIEMADVALYNAKRNGRHRVEIIECEKVERRSA